MVEDEVGVPGLVIRAVAAVLQFDAARLVSVLSDTTSDAYTAELTEATAVLKRALSVEPRLFSRAA